MTLSRVNDDVAYNVSGPASQVTGATVVSSDIGVTQDENLEVRENCLCQVSQWGLTGLLEKSQWHELRLRNHLTV